MPAVKRVAVIGAGACGLTATKACLDEGLEPVCFERADDVGGLWRFTEKVRDGQSCVMSSTVSNTTKEMSSFSDFPPPMVMRYEFCYMDSSSSSSSSPPPLPSLSSSSSCSLCYFFVLFLPVLLLPLLLLLLLFFISFSLFLFLFFFLLSFFFLSFPSSVFSSSFFSFFL